MNSDEKLDDNDKLWALLGKSRQSAVSPFFSRNVLRAIRQGDADGVLEEGVAGRSSFVSQCARLGRALHRRSWQAVVAGTCAFAVLAAIGPSPFVRHRASARAPASFAGQIVVNPDYETIKHLDELVADEESSLWLDDSVN